LENDDFLISYQRSVQLTSDPDHLAGAKGAFTRHRKLKETAV